MVAVLDYLIHIYCMADQSISSAQQIVARVDFAALDVQSSLQNNLPADNYGLRRGLAQWYEDLEKNVLGRVHPSTYYLHQLYQALLKEIYATKTATALVAWQAFYAEFQKQTAHITSFDKTPLPSFGLESINSVLNYDYE